MRRRDIGFVAGAPEAAMALITIQVIEGLERGKVYDAIPTPVTIGREDENRIRLNDERVSRFHAKIQEDGGRIILTDLESTNGTRVNGQPIQMRVLQIGDQLSIGRCLLIFGSRDEIVARAAEMQSQGTPFAGDGTIAGRSPDDSSDSGEFEEGRPLGTALFPEGAPPAPTGLRPVQRAELSDLLAYVHDQIQNIVQSAREAEAPPEGGWPEGKTEGPGAGAMVLPWLAWQRMLSLEMDLAVTLRNVADPDG